MKSLLVMLLTVALAGCGSSKPAAQLYTLRAQPLPMGRCTHATSIKIHEPIAGAGLDSARIAVMEPGGKQTFYNGVRWNAPATRMVQHYLADRFEQSGMFSTVTTDDSTTRAAWVLESQLRAFHIDQSDGSARVVIRLSASLVDASTHKARVTYPLQATVSAQDASMEQISALFNQQMDGLSRQLLQSLRTTLPGC